MAWIGAGDIKPVINLKNIDIKYFYFFTEKLCRILFFGGICLTNSFQNCGDAVHNFFEGDAFFCLLADGFHIVLFFRKK